MIETARWTRRVQPWERADGSLQVGPSPSDGLVLGRLAPAERAFLLAVGSVRQPADRGERGGGRGDRPMGRSPAAVPSRVDAAFDRAVRDGADPARLREIMTVLTEAGLLEVRQARRRRRLPAESPPGQEDRAPQLSLDEEAALRTHGPGGPRRVAARAHRTLLVDGDGPVPRRISAVLKDAGFGRVQQGEAAADDADLALRSASDEPPPDLVILTFAGVASAARGAPWQRRGIPHLPVVVDPHRVSVGPLVLPGAPCLRCVDLHRGDRDPSWPLLLAQSGRDFQTPSVGCDSALTVIVAGLVACLARPLLEDGLHLPGVSLEVTLPDPDVIRRQWQVHPLCGCGFSGRDGPGAARRTQR